MRHWTEETNWQPLSAVVSRLKRQVEEAYHYCRKQEADEAHDDLVRAEWRLRQAEKRMARGAGTPQGQKAANEGTIGMTNIISLKDPEAYRIAMEASRAGKSAAEEWMRTHEDSDACGIGFVYIEAGMGARMAAIGAHISKSGNEYLTTVSCGNWQSLSAIEHVAEAIVASLESNGVKARMECRMD